MRRPSLLLTAAVLASSAGFAPAPAATVRVIEMHNNFFRARSTVVAPGDTVRFVNRGATRTVSVYSGTSWSGTATSVQVPTGESRDVIASYAGGEARISASPGASISSGNCSGMCGRLSSDGPAFQPEQPTITAPEQDETLTANRVSFEGTAVSAGTIRLEIDHLPGNPPLHVEVFGQIAGDASFTVTSDVPNGTFTATATGIHPDGFESPASDPVTFTVAGGDLRAPTLTLGVPMRFLGSETDLKLGTYFAGNGVVDVNGTVYDDVSAKQVVASVAPADAIPGGPYPVILRCRTVDPEPTGSPTACDSALNPARISFRGSWLPPRPGVFTLTVTATDAAGKVTTKRQTLIVLSSL